VKYPAAAQLVIQHLGLDTESLGAATFPAAVADHMRVLAVADELAYVDVLSRNPTRLQELVERLIVRETWFFRVAELFRHLAQALPALLRSRTTQRPYRVLSLPCSTGEEPYSLALKFLDAGLAPELWRIDAVDLSQPSLDTAARGVYRELSFRQTTPEVRNKYFRPVANAWELSPDVRRLVAFRRGNILDVSFAQENAQAYDLIVCRNLLIYLTPAARLQAVANLEAMLKPDGWLALGHAEPHVLGDRAFQRLGPEGCFLFGRKAARVPVAPSMPLPAFAPAPAFAAPRLSAPTPFAAPHALAATPSAATAIAAIPTMPPPETSLRCARDLADANRLEDALAECQRHLKQHGPSAEAYALLGLVQQARGELDAALEHFRKTLYLDPTHREALTHAMLLAAQRGDTARAVLMRERLARLQPGETT